MRVDEDIRGQLVTRFEVLLPHLDERQQRLAGDPAIEGVEHEPVAIHQRHHDLEGRRDEGPGGIQQVNAR